MALSVDNLVPEATSAFVALLVAALEGPDRFDMGSQHDCGEHGPAHDHLLLAT